MDVYGETFHVRLEGPDDAPVVMLSNSLGTDLRMWDAQVPDLARWFRVIRYDSRGHGGSTADDGPYSIEQLGRDAVAILRTLGVKRAHWIGLSLGGMVGQWLLANAGDLFERAVIANTMSHYADSRGWNARIAMVRSRGMAEVTPGILQRWVTPQFLRDHPEKIAPLEATLRAASPMGYSSCCAAIRDMDLRQERRRIKTPTLVIVGAKDLSTPPVEGHQIAADIAGAVVRELDAAHLSNIEQASEFTRLAVDFLLKR